MSISLSINWNLKPQAYFRSNRRSSSLVSTAIRQQSTIQLPLPRPSLLLKVQTALTRKRAFYGCDNLSSRNGLASLNSSISLVDTDKLFGSKTLGFRDTFQSPSSKVQELLKLDFDESQNEVHVGADRINLSHVHVYSSGKVSEELSFSFANRGMNIFYELGAANALKNLLREEILRQSKFLGGQIGAKAIICDVNMDILKNELLLACENTIQNLDIEAWFDEKLSEGALGSFRPNLERLCSTSNEFQPVHDSLTVTISTKAGLSNISPAVSLDFLLRQSCNAKEMHLAFDAGLDDCTSFLMNARQDGTLDSKCFK